MIFTFTIREGEREYSNDIKHKKRMFRATSRGRGGERENAKEIKGSNLKHQTRVQELSEESDSQLIRLTFATAVAAF